MVLHVKSIARSRPTFALWALIFAPACSHPGAAPGAQHGSAHEPASPPPLSRQEPAHDLQSSLEAKVIQDDFSGVMLAVHNGAAVASVARGVLGAPGTPAITAAARFNIASAGKMFTAVAIAQLVDAGKLGFADAVGKYVPELPAETAAVTIDQLLTHTSGLGDYFSPENIPTLHRARSAADLLPLIVSEKPQFPPGTQFRYSNSGFALLGAVIERVSGMVYGDYLREHVFRPAGMESTSLDPRPLDTLAQPLTNKSQGGSAGPLHPAPGAMLHGSPAGGAFSSALDLQKFADALRANRLASAPSTAALLQRRTQGSAPDRGYGYGFGIKTRNNRTWVGHNGGTLGTNAEFEFAPGGEWTLIVLSNRDPPSATREIEYLEDLVASGPPQ